MKKLNKLFTILFLLTISFSGVFALTNNGFETGDFTGWNVDGNWEVTSDEANSGNNSALMNASTMEQSYSELTTEWTYLGDPLTRFSYYCNGNNSGQGAFVIKAEYGGGDAFEIDQSSPCSGGSWSYHYNTLNSTHLCDPQTSWCTSISTNNVTNLRFYFNNDDFPTTNSTSYYYVDDVAVCGDGECELDENTTNCYNDCYVPTTTTLGQFEETFTEVGEGTGNFIQSITSPLANVMLGLGMVSGILFIIYAVATLLQNAIVGGKE